MTPALVAWDFDGVLNRNIVDGAFVWLEGFDAALGLSAASMVDYCFTSGRFGEVLVGQRDILDLVEAWLATVGAAGRGAEVLTYWFTADAHPDAQVLDWVAASPARAVIATNNEARRAHHIWHDMGFRTRFAHMFAAGPMRVRKPDPAFFAAIAAWSGLPPAQILLVDDTAANVAAARALGWQGFHFTEASRGDLPAVLGLSGA